MQERICRRANPLHLGGQDVDEIGGSAPQEEEPVGIGDAPVQPLSEVSHEIELERAVRSNLPAMQQPIHAEDEYVGAEDRDQGRADAYGRETG